MATKRGNGEGDFVRHLGATMDRLHSIWDEIGITSQTREIRTKTVMQHLDDLLKEMISEEESLKNKILHNIEKYGEELLKLSKELQVSAYEPEDGLSMIELEADLRKRADMLHKEKHGRLKQLKHYHDLDQNLCDIMCTTPYYIPSGMTPSHEQLKSLQAHVEALQEEQSQRLKTFQTTKLEIISLLEDLDQCPNTSFERDVVCESDDSFLLSSENMKALRLLHEELAAKQKECYALASQLRENMERLWNRLQVPQEERSSFHAAHTGYKGKVIQAIRDEISRCELLKIANLRSVVEQTREELVSWWDKCYVGEQQREKFTAFHADEMSEELLEEHEHEVAHMKQYYTEYHDMFEKVEKWEVLWKKFLEFERKASDPTRFFNRGCNLLKEEKARKKNEKELPKVEEDVLNQIEEWEQQMGRKFLVRGQSFSEYIKVQREEFVREKEQEKKNRTKEKEKKMQEEIMFGSKPITPAKRRIGGTPGKTPGRTPNKKTKLGESAITPRTPRTPGASVSRLGRSTYMNSMFQSPSLMTRSGGKKAALTPGRGQTLTRSALKEKNSNDTLFSHTTVANPNSTQSSIASVGHYNEFAVGLNPSARPNCRSSVAPRAAYF